MRTCFILITLLSSTALASNYQDLERKSVPVYDLKPILLPYVASCDGKRGYFKRLFCDILYERLRELHQNKIYHSIVDGTKAGPLNVRFKAKPTPQMEISVQGCLTCKGPMLQRKGGNVSKGRFFMLKEPKNIKIRRGKLPYDFGDISVKTYLVDLPKDTTFKKFKEEIYPFL